MKNSFTIDIQNTEFYRELMNFSSCSYLIIHKLNVVYLNLAAKAQFFIEDIFDSKYNIINVIKPVNEELLFQFLKSVENNVNSINSEFIELYNLDGKPENFIVKGKTYSKHPELIYLELIPTSKYPGTQFSYKLEYEKGLEKQSKGQQALIYLLEDFKAIQTELQTTNNRLKIVNEDLETFNYSASHDLKAPLRTINNYAQFLKEELEKNLEAEQKNMLDEVIVQSKKMSDLLDDLLRFSRTGNHQLEFSIIKMKKMVSSVVQELLTEDQKQFYTIEIQELPNAFGDYYLIKQVIINLITNAIKFTSEEENPKIIIGYKIHIDKILYFVADNGVGFNQSASEQIFKLFVQLKHSLKLKQGTGVGLAIVKRIIEKHDGELFVESELNKGAKIGFSLNKVL